MSLWQYHSDVNKWDDITEVKKEEIINILLSTIFINAYDYPSILSSVIAHLTDEKLITKLFDFYINNINTYVLSNDIHYLVICQVHEKIKDKQHIKNALVASKNKKLNKVFLLLDDRTEKEEELGLRALSGIKYAPSALYIKRYKPTLNVVENLPPVMRLNIFETLLNNANIAYNIFENFADEDKFKALLFGSVLRHRDRVEVICDKYREMKDLGSEATVIIKCDCKNCGEYDVSIKSTRVRTQTGLNKTKLGRWVSRKACLLCGSLDEGDKQIICEGSDG